MGSNEKFEGKNFQKALIHSMCTDGCAASDADLL